MKCVYQFAKQHDSVSLCSLYPEPKKYRSDSICFYYPCYPNHQKSIRVGKEVLKAFTCLFLTRKTTLFSMHSFRFPYWCLIHMYNWEITLEEVKGKRSRVKDCIKFYNYKKKKDVNSWKLYRMVFKKKQSSFNPVKIALELIGPDLRNLTSLENFQRQIKMS